VSSEGQSAIAARRRPAVFFDRDGTLMKDVDYCRDPKDVFILPGVREALGRLKAAGFKNIVITNQSGIGRGYLSDAQYRAVEAEVLRHLGADLLDATYYCPDVPWQPSTRRKPETGMVLEAVNEHAIDLSRSFFIGDRNSDVECGIRAGIRTIFVPSESSGQPGGATPDFVAKDIVEAADIVLKNTNV
jgi:histidinol-phosphate phosphatase family protein